MFVRFLLPLTPVQKPILSYILPSIVRFSSTTVKKPVSPLEAVAEGLLSLPSPSRTSVRSSYQQQIPSSAKPKTKNTIINNKNDTVRSTHPSIVSSSPVGKPKRSSRPSTTYVSSSSSSSYSPVYSPPPLHVTTSLLTPAPIPTTSSSSSSSSDTRSSITTTRNNPKNTTLFRSLPTDAVLDEQHSLSIAIIGEPNAGKSTLLNHLIKAHVSAVSPKYNTTRTRILGVCTEGNTQLLFHDTPGLVHEGGESGWKYHKELVTASLDAASDADYIVYVIDIARRFDETLYRSLRTAIQLCIQYNSKLLIVANKCDLIKGLPLDTNQKQLSEKIFSPSVYNNGSFSPSTFGISSSSGVASTTGIPKASNFLVSSLVFPNSFINSSSFTSSSFSKDTTSLSTTIRNESSTVTSKPSTVVARGKLHQDVLSLKLDILANTMETLCLEYDTELAKKTLAASARTKASIKSSTENKGSKDDEDEEEENRSVSIPRRARNLLVPGCILPLAAVHNNGIDLLRTFLISSSPVRPWLYSKNIITDRSIMEQIADIIREKLFRRLHYEIPYTIHQETRSWRELEATSSFIPPEYLNNSNNINPKRITEIHQDIIVPAQRVARMLLVQKGLPIKEIAELAKVDIEKIIKTRVRLHLHITVKENRKNFN